MSAISSQRSAQPKQALVLVVLIACLASSALTGCAAKFIGDYDAAIDNGVSDIQQRAEVYLGKLKADPSVPYDPNFYNDINARLIVLKTRAQLTPQYSIIVQQIQELQSQFDKLQTLDKSLRPMPIGVSDAAESSITISVESILRLELALKRGDKNPPSLSTTK